MAKKNETLLGAQLYTVRDYCKTPKDIAKTLKRIAKIGYKKVQISGIGPIDTLDLRKILDDNGLQAAGHHCNLGDLRTDIVGLIDMLHALSCEYTAVAYLGEEERKTGGDWKKRAIEMSKFGKELQQEGITLQYHNHSFEMKKFTCKAGAGRTGLEILYEESDSKALQAEIDTYWIAHGGGDPAAWCEAMKGRLDQVHFKDGVMTDAGLVITEVGEGNLNWPAILKAVKKVKSTTAFVEQDGGWKGNNPFKSLTIAYENLRKLGVK